ncbi:MAG TPA: DUF1223 domain-containing protein [Steroidobacteraceae bacterium]|jgi:hypothetical protein|nr:DUF1223 domain-containing protein [Steroidobacteraceae bacterium]
MGMRALLLTNLLTASLLFTSGSLHAGQRPSVVELFTSEGCSSCPPAEAYIGELAKRPDVLALSFHVDYWDDLGWRDRFDIPEAASRQRGYARALNLTSVYTPQVVVDGERDFPGSDRSKIGKSLSSPRSGIPVRIAVRDGAVLIDLAGTPGISPSEVLLVGYQRSAISAIGRGENAGRTLTEYNIVRAVRHLGNYTGEAREYGANVASLPKEATDVAVLVQLLHQGPVIAAASLSLR